MDLSEYQKKIRGNIWKYALYIILDHRLYTAYVAIYFLSFPDHLVQQIGIYIALGQVAGFVFEIPSGYLSDKIGHKYALVLSRVIMAASSLAYVIGGNLFMFILGSIGFNIGRAFRTGTMDALMHETLQELRMENRFSQVTGRIRSITFGTSALMLFLVPLSVEFGLRTPFIISLGLDVIAIIVALSFITPRRALAVVNEVRNTNFKAVLKDAHRRHFTWVVLLTALVVGVVVGAGLYRDVYQQSIGISLLAIGWFFALSRIFASVFSYVTPRIKSILSFQQYLFVWGVLSGIAYICIGIIDDKWAVAGIFSLLIGYTWGQGELTKHYQLDYIRDSNFKATQLSLGSWLYLVYVGVTSLGFGYMAGVINLSQSFIYYGLGFVLFFVVMYAVFIKKTYRI